MPIQIALYRFRVVEKQSQLPIGQLVSIINIFIKKVTSIYETGVATEHSYRSAIESLFTDLSASIRALNEPKRVACGAPDFIVQRGVLAIGHVEAKDIGVGLRDMKDTNKNQQDRYRKALPNLIYTNCLDWDFYRNGDLIGSITIADFLLGIQPNPEQYQSLEKLLHDFIEQRPQKITSPNILAKMMAGKASLIKDVLYKALKADENSESEISNQYEAFKQNLIHDITPQDFADIYAETIAYGMFAARMHDTTPETFSRQEALTLLPKSNPFLRNLFTYLAGYDLDDRIAWIIDDLAEIFRAVDIAKIMSGFGKLTGQSDPFLHFYETFLAAYNPGKRKARGVWYTPQPVVNFIVRAVDDVLQKEFGVTDGLADTTKLRIDWDTGQVDKKGKKIVVKKDVHRVQILDPATGTGTFLSEVIKQIAPKIVAVAPSMWSPYIEQNLVPRLHGFELLMASYAMCHMKLDMILTELGYKPSGAPPRLSVYLTNSLEVGEPANQTLPFAQWLSNEVKQANTIKHDMPIMCILGNPPYAVSSSNKGAWINSLVSPYKDNLAETSINALSDDYVKFIRLAESYVEKNKNGGVVAMITNNSFVDGVVHRQMRHHLRRTFDLIYIINLHGDSNKMEMSPDGSVDKNVFDIKQGVAIMIAVKSGKAKDKLADVYVKDIWGNRESKYTWLGENSLETTKFVKANFHGDYHFFTNKPFGDVATYNEGFKINEFFLKGLSGIKFRKDKLLLTKNFSAADAAQMVDDVSTLDTPSLLAKYDFSETADWIVSEQKKNFQNPKENEIIKIAYRPFDFRYTYYPLDRISRIIPRGDSRSGLMTQMIAKENIALICGRQNKSGSVDHFFVTDCPSEMKTGERTIQSYHYPLYWYPEKGDIDQARMINFDAKQYTRLQELGTDTIRGIPGELHVFDYIYGILYCPAYRKLNAEFLKIDFARIPWPATSDIFWIFADKGESLRNLHLMDSSAIGPAPYPLVGDGSNMITNPRFEDGKILINDLQYFDGVPETAWAVCVGGYQPALKWLSDRRGRMLSFDDTKYYQKVIKVLSETARIISEIVPNATLEI
jgi:predicted helicase